MVPEMPRRRHHHFPHRDDRYGSYFITVCTRGRMKHLGERTASGVHLNALGERIDAYWRRIAAIHPTVTLDEYVVMPNHMHGILHLGVGGPSQTLGMIINQFKGAASKMAAREFAIPAGVLWQRDFHEHVIRGDASINRIRDYIAAHRIVRSHVIGVV